MSNVEYRAVKHSNVECLMARHLNVQCRMFSQLHPSYTTQLYVTGTVRKFWRLHTSYIYIEQLLDGIVLMNI